MHQRTAITAVFRLTFTLLVLTVTASCTQPDGKGLSRETLKDRVVNAGKIRCGYVVYPPGSIKDPNTGELSGIFIDTLEKAGEALGLKIEWSEEVGWGSMIEGLLTDRYDLVCSPVWANASRAKLVGFSTPLFFSGIGIYVRKAENRFTGQLEKIDSPDVRIATIDGEMSDIISRSQFPKAQRISLPQLSDVSQILLNVSLGKADVTFAEAYLGQQFLANNPDTIENIVSGRPIRVFPNTMIFKQGEPEFKTMLDVALKQLVNSGYMDELLGKYEAAGTFYRVAYPYHVPR